MNALTKGELFRYFAANSGKIFLRVLYSIVLGQYFASRSHSVGLKWKQLDSFPQLIFAT